MVNITIGEIEIHNITWNLRVYLFYVISIKVEHAYIWRFKSHLVLGHVTCQKSGD